MANSTYLLASLCYLRDIRSYSLLRNGHIDDELFVDVLTLLFHDDRNNPSEVNQVSKVPSHDTRNILPFPPDPVIHDESSLFDSALHVARELTVGIVLRFVDISIRSNHENDVSIQPINREKATNALVLTTPVLVRTVFPRFCWHVFKASSEDDLRKSQILVKEV